MWLVRAAVGFVAFLLAVFAVFATAAFFYLSKPESPPAPKAVLDYSEFGLDKAVGLYRLPDKSQAILTYSAGGGLSLYRLENARFSRDDYLSTRFIPEHDGTFTWEPWGEGEPRTVRFTGSAEEVTGFAWQDSDGRHTARRIPAAFSQHDLEWQNGNVTLAGTAFVPQRRAKAGAVMLHGSGTSHRDNLWYLHIALQMVDSGIAVLLPDKRGSGRSGGEWRTASFTDFALDGLAAREVLVDLIDLPIARIGLVGISQGGSWVTPIATTMTNDLPFVINVSGAAVSPNRQLAHETRQTLRQHGVPEFLDFFVHPYAVAIPKRRRSVWWDTNGSYDPIADWQDCWTPALFIYGSEDERDNVPVSTSVGRLSPIAEQRPGFEVMVLDGVGHGLMDPETRELRPDFLTAVSDWALNYAGQSD